MCSLRQFKDFATIVFPIHIIFLFCDIVQFTIPYIAKYYVLFEENTASKKRDIIIKKRGTIIKKGDTYIYS